jgi:peptidoglycan-N-acetylglucosamine deacetylase
VVKALVFGLLFVLTNASLVLLYPPTISRFLATLALYAAGTALMLVLLFIPSVGWLARAQTTLPASGAPMVALTFDDGPTPEVTPRVLAILRAKAVPATFFFVGEQVDAHPELAQAVRDAGHAIGNHTYSHPPLFCFLTQRRLHAELVQGQDAIRRATGTTPRLFRSPVGLKHPLLENSLRRAGLTFVLWNVRSFDTWTLSGPVLRRRVLEGATATPGSIVLFHDRPGRGADTMLEVLPGVIDQLLASGFRIVTL